MAEQRRGSVSGGRGSVGGGRGRPRTGVRESVITAAAELLAEAGVVGFTTRAVAERAGVAESSIFYHFGDRAGLLQEIIVSEVGGYKAMVDQLIKSDIAPDRGVKRLLDFLEDYYLRILPGLVAVQADPALLTALRDSRMGTDPGPHRGVGPVRDYLASQQAAGRIGDRDLGALALLIVGAAFQRALARRFGANRAQPTTAQVANELLTLAGE